MATAADEKVQLVHNNDADEPKKKYGSVPAYAISVINFVIFKFND